MTLVAQIDAPVASSGRAEVADLPSRMARMSSTAEAALNTDISMITAMLPARTIGPPRSIRNGLAMVRAIPSAASRIGSRY